MKKIITLLVLLVSIYSYSQDAVDIVTPQQSPFNAGQNIEGWVQGSVNEPTGKVTFSEPLATINARTVSYNVALGYSGKAAFDIGSYTNKFAPTSTVGVGFSMFTPKIVVDNKNTGTREDDVFYLQDGATNSKLLCTSRTVITPATRGPVIWEFEAEKYVPWKIQYYKSSFDIINGVIQEVPLDYWKITTDQGIQYYYGRTQNARENIVAWGNWIGSSKRAGGQQQTIVWNVSRIQDQWGNNIRFEYELQESTIGGVKQTEASYLKKIISSTGEHIAFTYENKNSAEYYEPHKEQVEPDAYQERYEKKALRYVDSYNSENSLIYRHSLAYTLVNNSSSSDKKRYLQSITRENNAGEILPGKSFEYHTSGSFKGGLKKIHYPLGGSATYHYTNKALFSNVANRYTGSRPDNSDYTYYAMVSKDNYSLKFYKSKTSVGGLYTFKVNRSSWNGKNWVEDEYVIPDIIRDEYPNGQIWLENFQAVFGKDYYAFLYTNGVYSNIHLFHLKPNGHYWESRYLTKLIVGGGTPSLLSGDNFVAIGTHLNGTIYRYIWDGEDSWKSDLIQQGPGQYYYGATNNFILSLNEDGGIDMKTNAIHEDNYYIHYLDLENKWNTKSWSAAADPFIAGIEKPSYFYPENSMSGFVADDNPEFYLRWDTDYNLLVPDNIFGAHLDANPIIPTGSGMAVLQSYFYQAPLFFNRFNGIEWKGFIPLSSAHYSKPAYGEDIMTFQNQGGANSAGYAMYDPNSNSWTYDKELVTYPWYQSNDKLTGITRDFLIVSDKIYKYSNTSLFPVLDTTMPYDNVFTYTDGLGHAFVKLASHTISGNTASTVFQQGMYYYVNRSTNQVTGIDVGKMNNLAGPNLLAGRTPFMSPKTMWLRNDGSSFNTYLHRIIDDKVNNLVKDIVVDNIQINDGKGEVRKIQYTYSDPNSDPNNTSTFYGTVTIQNKGYGNGAIGTIEKKYNTGVKDIRFAGLLLEEHAKNKSNVSLTIKKNNWRKYKVSSLSYAIKLGTTTNSQNLNGAMVTNEVTNTYSWPYYLNTLTTRKNSLGQIEKTITKYAYDQYSFMKEGNFVSQPYEVISQIDGKVISVGRTVWVKNSNSKVYASQIWSGTSTSNLRKSYEVSRINSYGQVEESNNGKGQYNTIIYGLNYRYPILSLSNTRYNTFIDNLDVSMNSLQAMNVSGLKTELSKLYTKLPNTMIEITSYDDEGKIVKKIDNRQEEINYYYDSFNRLDYITDHDDNMLKKNIYNYKSN
ncbi:hypothetical protein [Aquimarina mytili]|uniref:YD repeat-containing protein n=1 Tax=Aquimarina mytili TaxID=874423 RepID=A0A937D9Y4_9FLAO|nr:hypothetical protein [Aquimarina mytili]MBL0684177.1 hypothetical protein [Aquimarina mytili]